MLGSSIPNGRQERAALAFGLLSGKVRLSMMLIYLSLSGHMLKQWENHRKCPLSVDSGKTWWLLQWVTKHLTHCASWLSQPKSPFHVGILLIVGLIWMVWSHGQKLCLLLQKDIQVTRYTPKGWDVLYFQCRRCRNQSLVPIHLQILASQLWLQLSWWRCLIPETAL